MTIEKLPSGSTRIKLQEKGKRYSITVPYAVKDEIEAYKLIRERIDHPNSKYDTMTFKEASRGYIKMKTNALSPSTIRGYEVIINNLPDTFMKCELREIDNVVLQNVVNLYAVERSAKSVRNAYGFISAVLGTFNPNMTYSITLPQKVVKEPYIPSEDDVKKLLEYVKTDKPHYYVFLSLACLGMRRSEICALTTADLSADNVLTINKALVPDKDNNYVIKPNAKTDASNRTIVIPDDLANLIREKGIVYDNNPNSVDRYLRRTLPKLGIEFFSVHKLRHFFASYTHDKGYSDAVIRSLGGWSTDNIMKTVYRHAMKKEEAKQNIANDIGSLL